jgi:CNT family concentrative nucleoside transporter
MRGILGLAVIVALAWALSERRRAIPYRTVAAALALQFLLALILLRLPASQILLSLLNRAANSVATATDAGTALVFGYLGGAPLPFAATGAGSPYILAFRGLPLVLTISALSAVLYYWGVMQKIMGTLAWGLRRTLGIGGPLALAAAVHIFVGMIEAPLLIRPTLGRLHRGELFAVMSCGMAGIAGTVMVIYAGLLGGIIANPLGNILIASVISTPAALALSALMVPFGPPEDAPDDPQPDHPHPRLGTLEALVRGAMDGVAPLAGIIVLLITAVATVTLLNQILALLPPWAGQPITLQSLAALAFRPLMWLIGIPWAQAAPAALLMATKTVLNEFVAYIDLAALPQATLAPRARLILSYALCGFANFGSLGILIGGLGAMVPPVRRAEVVSLGMRSLISGTLATCMSGAWAGLLAP